MAQQRRILLLITDLEIGGTPTVVRELAVRLRPFAHVEVACLKRRGPVADELRDAGVTVTAFDAARPWHLPRTVGRLRRLVRDRQIDTIFSFLVHANAVAAAGSLTLPRVRFIQSIQTTQPEPAWHWTLQAVATARAERVVVPSPSAAEAARRWASVRGKKLVVIPNAVDVAGEPAPPRPPHEPFAIGFVGRLDPVKRVDLLVTQYAAVRRALGDRASHLHVFGDGPERSRIERLIAEHGLPPHVTMHGFVPPAAAYGRIDLLVLPSIAEGFGLVLIEAMAAGVAVAASDVPGIRDVVRDGETGVLFHPHSPAELTPKLVRLVRDDPYRRHLAAAAQVDVRRRFSWPVVLPQYRRLLQI